MASIVAVGTLVTIVDDKCPRLAFPFDLVGLLQGEFWWQAIGLARASAWVKIVV